MPPNRKERNDNKESEAFLEKKCFWHESAQKIFQFQFTFFMVNHLFYVHTIFLKLSSSFLPIEGRHMALFQLWIKRQHSRFMCMTCIKNLRLSSTEKLLSQVRKMLKAKRYFPFEEWEAREAFERRDVEMYSATQENNHRLIRFFFLLWKHEREA